MPGSFIAEEATYFLMTRSLWEEGDLLWTWKDSRYAAAHHRGGLADVVLMTPDRGERVYFAKPYLYSIVAVPFYALLGTNGFLVFNALMFVLLASLGIRYLRSCNPPVRAVLLGGSFFLFSASVPYIFWIQPEVFNMLTLFLGCYFWLYPGPGMAGAAGGASPAPVGLRDPVVRVGLAGFFFALSAFSKLPHLAFGAALVLHCLFTRRWGRMLSALLAFLLTLTVLHMGQLALSETVSVYHSTRKSFSDLETFPHNVPSAVAWRQADQGGVSRYGGGGMGLVRLDGRAAYNVKYLFLGRHTGLFPYFFPALAALGLYLLRLRSRRMAGRGFLLLALLMVLLFYILWFPANYQGGPHFVGNRHVVSIYPAFLFLVGSVAGVSVHLVSWAIAGLFLAQVIFSPFGAAGPRSDLQGHARSPLFRLLPYETTLRYVPGYAEINFGMKFTPKRYLVRLLGGGRLILEGTRFRLVGQETAELLVVSRQPLARLIFLSDSPLVEAWCRGAEGRVIIAGLPRFSPDPLRPPVTEEELRLVLEKPRPNAVHTDWRDREKRFFYRVAFRRLPGGEGRRPGPSIRLAFLGEGEPWFREAYFHAMLEYADVPELLMAGEQVAVPVRVLSRSPFAWDRSVRLSYHWRRASYDPSIPGAVRVWDGLQTLLPGGVLGPGELLEGSMQVRAPGEAGDYVLELDLVADQVAWFAAKSAAREPLGRFPVRVLDNRDGDGDGDGDGDNAGSSH